MSDLEFNFSGSLNSKYNGAVGVSLIRLTSKIINKLNITMDVWKIS